MRFLAVAALLAACSDSGSATLRVRVQGGAPAYVTVSAYAARSHFQGRRLDPPLPADTVEPLSDFTPWRIFAWGYTGDQRTSFGTVEAHPAASGETMALVTLGTDLPVDSDGDGVPDQFDDCPQTPDPDQGGNCSLDAGTSDGPPPADAANVSDGPTGPNLIANPGCEGNTMGWDGYHSTLTLSPIAHTGNFSCMVCLNAGFTDYTIDDNPNTVSMPLTGQLYAASAYVRAVPNAITTQTVKLTLREHLTNSSSSQAGTGVTINDTWQQVTSAFRVNQDGVDLDIFIGTIGQPGDCFLVDDILLVRAL